jgi:hypothetical protein
MVTLGCVAARPIRKKQNRITQIANNNTLFIAEADTRVETKYYGLKPVAKQPSTLRTPLNLL